jgi:hypothetical protein
VPGGGERFVHIRAGIHGIGNLNAAQRDWRNPVAEINDPTNPLSPCPPGIGLRGGDAE